MMGVSRYSWNAGISYLTNSAQPKKQTAATDGKITKNEFVNARPVGVSREQAQAMFADMDSKKAGAVSREEIVKALGKNAPSKPIADKLSDTVLTTLLISVKMKASRQTATA